MILYISGLNSTYKPYIPATLNAVFDQPAEYYVIQNVISADLARLQEIIHLLYSLDKNNPDHPILNERPLIEELIRHNEQFYFDGREHPVYCAQGRLDDRVDVAYNAHFVQSAKGTMEYLDHLGHRFTEPELGDLLGKIRRYC